MISMIRVEHKKWRRGAGARNKFIILLKQEMDKKVDTNTPQ